MKIQWFPGHMHKARLQIQETLPRVDLVIEVLDARIPFSSENPMLAELRGEKPCLKVLAKSDLADPQLTQVWQNEMEKSSRTRVCPVTTQEIPTIRNLKTVMNQMIPNQSGKSITTMVAGIPNVGKSTIINILAGRKIAKTGNEPAVTKGQQRIQIGDGIALLDTPGVLWPNVENVNSGYRLALVGSVKETAMDYADVGFFGARFLISRYPERMVERYSLSAVPESDLELIESIGRHRGCLRKNNIVDIDRASKILVTELRAGKLGRITLETPEIMELEKAETATRVAEEAVAKQQKDAKRKQAYKDKKRSGNSPRRKRK